jgi:xanthine dehydrogenase YagT iron-sulfur-binding subunit
MKNPPEEQLSKQEKKSVSRRAFLRGAGAATAGTVALGAGMLSFTLEERQVPPAILGPGKAEVQFTVNGQLRTVWVEPRTTLAEALREHLNLTGTKIGCDRGSCSACTVWLDGKPINSCLALAVDVAGQQVTTVEGLAADGKLHPVQEAFIEHDATMCGFCTPGMVMSCAALLKRNPNPTLEDVKMATSGNLCRCGTYPKVFDATLAAAKKAQLKGIG